MLRVRDVNGRKKTCAGTRAAARPEGLNHAAPFVWAEIEWNEKEVLVLYIASFVLSLDISISNIKYF